MWENLPWVTEFAMIRAGIHSQICQTPGPRQFLLCHFTVLKGDRRIEKSILRRKGEYAFLLKSHDHLS